MKEQASKQDVAAVVSWVLCVRKRSRHFTCIKHHKYYCTIIASILPVRVVEQKVPCESVAAMAF